MALRSDLSVAGAAPSPLGGVDRTVTPLVGAIADKAGPRKPWLAAFSLATIACSGLLWFVLPEPSYVIAALLLAAFGNVTYELGQMVYNAMLPDLVPPSRVGRLSGSGWAMGYAGALACILLATAAFVWRDPPLFGLDPGMGEDARIFGPVVGIWFALFALPLFLFTPDVADRGSGLVTATRQGWGALRQTLREAHNHRGVIIFLLARMFYMDGLAGLYVLGPIFAVGVHGLSLDELMALAVLVSISAGIGAQAFGVIDDNIGPKAAILISIGGCFVFGVVTVAAASTTLFFVAITVAAVFGGAVQSVSRSMMARLAPADMRTQMFGLFALSGRVTVFVGPALIGWMTIESGSQRLGLAVVLPFFVVGFALMFMAPATPKRVNLPPSIGGGST